MMKFTKIIEFTTGRIDEFNAGLDKRMARSEGHRIPHRAVLTRKLGPRWARRAAASWEKQRRPPCAALRWPGRDGAYC